VAEERVGAHHDPWSQTCNRPEPMELHEALATRVGEWRAAQPRQSGALRAREESVDPRADRTMNGRRNPRGRHGSEAFPERFQRLHDDKTGLTLRETPSTRLGQDLPSPDVRHAEAARDRQAGKPLAGHVPEATVAEIERRVNELMLVSLTLAARRRRRPARRKDAAPTLF